MLNALPVVGWLLSLFFNIGLAVPFWICWTCCGIGRTYFYFLPPVYHDIGFWSCVGLFTVLGILKMFVPTFVSSSSTSNAAKAKKGD